MKKFSFRLQPVHDLREAKREQAERTLAASSASVRAAADRVEELRREHERSADAAADALGASVIDARQVELALDYLSALGRRGREASARLKELEAERERVRRAAAEAAREAETTARLRERAHARHEQMVAHAEQALLDEMAALAQARAMSGGDVD